MNIIETVKYIKYLRSFNFPKMSRVPGLKTEAVSYFDSIETHLSTTTDQFELISRDGYEFRFRLGSYKFLIEFEIKNQLRPNCFGMLKFFELVPHATMDGYLTRSAIPDMQIEFDPTRIEFSTSKHYPDNYGIPHEDKIIFPQTFSRQFSRRFSEYLEAKAV